MDRRRPLTLKAAWALMAALVLLAAGGCATDVPHLGRAVAGHLSVMQASRPVEDWLDDPTTSQAVRQRLHLAQAVREFASRELALPDNASYRRYADLGRSAVVWNVVAAPELSLELKTWCYPVMGCVGYRGHFDPDRAQREALQLREQGLEVLVYPVTAYSTLGWTNVFGGDPLLNTFAMGSPLEMARLVFHELAHQVAYAGSDMRFSESYATAVERLGLQRWAQHASSAEVTPAQWSAWQQRQARRREIGQLVLAHRQQLEALYRSRLAPDEQRRRKAMLQQELRAQHRALRDGPWQGDASFDAWVASLNNPALALQGSYEDAVPAFLALFEQVGGRFDLFHAEVQRLAAMGSEERWARLNALMPPHAPGS